MSSGSPELTAKSPVPSKTNWWVHYLVNPFLGLYFDICGGLFKADGCRFHIPRAMTTIGWRGACLTKGTYELEERRLIQKYVQAKDAVIELGACIGVVSCITNRLLANPARHLIVEANPYLIPWIFKNRETNQAGFLVEFCAVGNASEITFYINPKVIVDGSAYNKNNQKLRLPSRTFKELHERYGPFTTLIMDIEGSEADVFESSQDLLKNYRLIVVEMHDWFIGQERGTRCRQILTNSGFKMVEKARFTEVWLRP
jgi:FkbM family methyltransferase